MEDRKVFECIGYMKAKDGENDYSMFINENSYGSTGGFAWVFLDFCPDTPHEYGRIFIHNMSYDEIKRKIIHDNDLARVSGTTNELEARIKHLIKDAKAELAIKDKRIAHLESECTRLYDPTKKFWNGELEQKYIKEIEEIKDDIKSGNPELALQRCRKLLEDK